MIISAQNGFQIYNPLKKHTTFNFQQYENRYNENGTLSMYSYIFPFSQRH